jgi:hypothetical protein
MAATIIGAVVAAGTAVSSADAQRKGAHQAEDLQKANKPLPPPQAAKTPDVRRQTGGPVVPPPTMLTGATGVDPTGLNIGKNTLLGG